jgi:hypothetical protein
MLSKHFIAKTRRIHGFIVTYQWVNEEPCMCILRAFNGRNSSFVIALSAAYKYTDDSYLVMQAMMAAGHFGMHGEKSSAKIIADIILEGLDDLVRMAPEPEDAVIEREGKKLKPEFDARTNTVSLH